MRPSQSVLRISIVLPEREVTTSPGLAALPEGRFSQAATTPRRLTGNLARAAAITVPITTAAPDMS